MNNYRQFKSLQPDKQLLELEAELRKRYLLHDPAVQWLMQKAALASKEGSQWAIEKLKMILKA